MTIPEKYLAECEMVSPEPGAKNKEELLNFLTVAYVRSAKNVAECNIKRNAGIELQRKIAKRITLETDDTVSEYSIRTK